MMTVVAMALVIVVWKLPEEVGGGVVALETKAVGNEVSLEEIGLGELGAELEVLGGMDDDEEGGSEDGIEDEIEDGSEEGGTDDG